jgi:hypothetical protein
MARSVLRPHRQSLPFSMAFGAPGVNGSNGRFVSRRGTQRGFFATRARFHAGLTL